MGLIKLFIGFVLLILSIAALYYVYKKGYIEDAIDTIKDLVEGNSNDNSDSEEDSEEDSD